MAGQKFFLNLQGPKLPFQRVFLSKKQAENAIFCGLQAKLKGSKGHIWLAGRMLCIPALDQGVYYYVYVVTVSDLPYVHSKFVRQEAVGIYYVPWTAKKNCCPKLVHKFVCQKQPKTVQPGVNFINVFTYEFFVRTSFWQLF
jgi:hypothetical protein